MSLRRLAEETLQPPSFAFSRENSRWAEGRIALYPQGRQQSAVIPLLMRAQEQEGWVTRAAIEAVAAMLDMPYIRVLEVATFYTQFQLKPVGSRAHVQVCGTTPCMLRGAEDLRSVCQERIHHDPLELSEDGTLSWEEVECLGACVNAPMVAIGKDTFEDLTPGRLREILDTFAAGEGASVPTGPQNGRRASAPLTGMTTLTPDNDPGETTTTGPGADPAGISTAAAMPGATAGGSPDPSYKGRMRDVQEEQAPAFAGPGPQAKVSEEKAEAEQQRARDSRHADGTPNNAMREGATGAESAGGKIDGGAATGKETTGGRAGGGISTGVKPSEADAAPAQSQGARADVDTKQLDDAASIVAEQPGGPGVTSAATDADKPTVEIGGGPERGPESIANVDGNKKPEGGN